jgi:large subunit ribosomal protein L9
MEIILMDKVANLGNLGDVVNVKHGYARNYLIPQGMAKRATKINVAAFEERKAELEKIAAEKLASAQARADKLNGISVKISQKAGVDGRLFGSITNVDIASRADRAGLRSRQGGSAHAGRPVQGRWRVQRHPVCTPAPPTSKKAAQAAFFVFRRTERPGE